MLKQHLITIDCMSDTPYQQLLSFIDLTTLEGNDHRQKVLALCEKAKRYQTAAVCVYPTFAAIVRDALSGTSIKTACVAGAFPSGQSPIHIKVAEVQYAVAEGAEEIDMVISRGTFLEGRYDVVGDEIAQIKQACGQAHLKVILETGELPTFEDIRKASELAIANGADFIKTSTGKIPIAATLEASEIMLSVIREYYLKTGKKIGFKPAGGISEPETAMQYYLLVKKIVGDEWLHKDLFRIGASRLADRLFV